MRPPQKPAHAGLLDRAADAALAGRTGLTIAHHLSQAAACDPIIVMDRGRIIETGAHAERSQLTACTPGCGRRGVKGRASVGRTGRIETKSTVDSSGKRPALGSGSSHSQLDEEPSEDVRASDVETTQDAVEAIVERVAFGVGRLDVMVIGDARR